jgi:hypothetical protein
VMTSPHRIIRIHKAIPDIAYTDVVQAIANPNPNPNR